MTITKIEFNGVDGRTASISRPFVDNMAQVKAPRTPKYPRVPEITVRFIPPDTGPTEEHLHILDSGCSIARCRDIAIDLQKFLDGRKGCQNEVHNYLCQILLFLD